MPDYTELNGIVDKLIAAAVAAQKSADDSKLAALQASYDKLKAEYDAYKKAHPDSPKMLIGSNYGDGVDYTYYQGRPQVARIFLQGLSGTKFPNIAKAQAAVKDGIKVFVISWKDQNIANVKAFLDSIPKELKVYGCFNHEPENDHGNPGDASYKQWSTQWKNMWSAQAPVIRAAGFIPTQILMAWTLFPASKRDMADWTAPKGTVDVFAFDSYVNKFAPEEVVPKMVEAAKNAGVAKTGVAETGSQITDPQRPAKMKQLKTLMAEAGNFEWGIYWNQADPGFDCSLDKATADAWFNG